MKPWVPYQLSGDAVVSEPTIQERHWKIGHGGRVLVRSKLVIMEAVDASPEDAWIVIEEGGSVEWQHPGPVYANWWAGSDFGERLTRCRRSLNLSGSGPREVRIYGEQTLTTSALWTGTLARPATRPVRLVPESCVLHVQVPGGIGLDLTGAQKVTVSPMLEMVCEERDGRFPAAGLVASRNLQTDVGAGAAGAGEHRIDVRITGQCEVASMVLIGSESCRVDATLHNLYPGRAAFYASSSNHLGLVSADTDATIDNNSTSAQMDLRLEAWAPMVECEDPFDTDQAVGAVVLEGWSHVDAQRLVLVGSDKPGQRQLVLDSTRRAMNFLDLRSVYLHPYGSSPEYGVGLIGSELLSNLRMQMDGGKVYHGPMSTYRTTIRGAGAVDVHPSANAVEADWS